MRSFGERFRDTVARSCSPPPRTKPAEGFNYYTQQVYWNSFEVVREHINVAISGRPEIGWPQYLVEMFRTFETALFINCGNGWLERDLFSIGLINKVVGIDIGEAMIQDAVKAAELRAMPSQYIVTDCNTFDPSEDMKIDLVVNHAAMHHVAYVNRLTHTVSKMLKPGGKYVGYDYVGAHRNQYPWEMWSACLEFNATLPEPFRLKQIAYPHMRTMLHLDPSEAVHSELQLEVLKRYFEIEQFVPLGGPIAYHVLFGNNALFEARETEEGHAALQRVIAADRDFTTANPHTNLFAFWIAKPKTVMPSIEEIRRWQTEEDEREADAASMGGRYYPTTALEMIYEEMADLRHALSLVKAT